MASIPKTKTTNKVLFDTINDLRKLSAKTEINAWKAVAAKLAGPASQRSNLNLSKIEKDAKSGETIIIAGKVLGDGIFTKKLTIVAVGASESAKEKITKAGSTFVELKEYISKSPKGEPVIFK
jgi:large subunit ribosomal protein L18e